MSKHRISKVISGGQTGADRAGLDAAIDLGLDYGGAIPKSRLTEDGTLDPHYDRMTEMTSKNYPARTGRNVTDSDATLLFTFDKLGSGSALTAKLARKHHRPFLHINLSRQTDDEVVKIINKWLDDSKPEILNVAGSRESTSKGIYQVSIYLRKC
jgi:hypothetical protein